MKYYLSLILLIAFVGCDNEDAVEKHIDKTSENALNAMTVVDSVKHDSLDDTLQMALHRIDVIMRCRDLDDSAEHIYVQYAQGGNTYKNYLKAKKLYLREYDSVYVPLCNKLGLKPEGGKK